MEPPTFITSDSATDNLTTPESNNKRRRLTQACDACRKKKVKCSGDKPSCNNCTRLSITCTYLPSTRKRGPRVGLVESLEKRLQQMEKLLQPLKEQGIVDNEVDKKPVKKPRLNSKNSEINNNPTNTYTKDEQHQQSYDQFINTFSQTPVEQLPQQNQTSDVNNNPNDMTSEEKVGADPLFFGKSSANPGYHNPEELFIHCDRESRIKIELLESRGDSSPTDSNSSIEDIPIISPVPVDNGLPPAELVEHLVSLYFTFIGPQMSMLHEATFMRQLRQNKVAPFLVYSMCATSARFSKQFPVNKGPYLYGVPFADIAVNKYLFKTFDSPSIEHVQGLIMLTIHMYGIGKGPSAWMYTGMAIRMAQELGLHKVDETESKLDTEVLFIQREIRRRTWWACFRLDTFASCALGRPALIDEEDCDVRLPCDGSIWELEHPFESPSIDEIFKEEQIKNGTRIPLANIGMNACLISATALLGRICQYVNRSKPRDSLQPWDPNSQFIALENELDVWYKSLEPHYTYTRERMQQLMVERLGTKFALIHLIYYAAVLVLNRPNIAPLQNGEVEDRHIGFMLESAKKCCAAAKRISSITEDMNRFGGEYICPFTIYPVFVTATIHINNLYSSDINIAEDAKRNIQITEQFLESMGPYWSMAAKLIIIVREMKKRAWQDNNEDMSRNGSGQELITTESETRLKNYLSRIINNNSIIEPTNNLDNNSIIMPEQLLSPRWYNDTIFMGDSWTNFLRSPSPFASPNLLRLMKKEQDNSNQDDYFSQDLTTYNNIQAPSAFVYDGYSVIDMPSNWSTTSIFPLNPINRPLKHWTNINGNTMNSAIEDNPPISTSISFNPTSTSIDSII